MAHSAYVSPLDLYRLEVAQLADTDTPFGEVEDAINATNLAVDEKAALWMLAWSRLGPQAQQAQAEAKLDLVAAR
jgi:hypothetical protein